jgi:hypothetical protein
MELRRGNFARACHLSVRGKGDYVQGRRGLCGGASVNHRCVFCFPVGLPVGASGRTLGISRYAKTGGPFAPTGNCADGCISRRGGARRWVCVCSGIHSPTLLCGQSHILKFRRAGRSYAVPFHPGYFFRGAPPVESSLRHVGKPGGLKSGFSLKMIGARPISVGAQSLLGRLSTRVEKTGFSARGQENNCKDSKPKTNNFKTKNLHKCNISYGCKAIIFVL